MTDLLREVPADIHLGVLVVFAVGLIAWLFGRKLLKPILALSAVGLGAAAGLVAQSYVEWNVSPWWIIGGLALVAGLVALAAYRFTMGIMLALALAVACPLVSFTYAELTGQYDDAVVEGPEGEELLLPSLPGIDDPELEEKIRGAGERVIEEADRRARDIEDRARERAEGGGGAGTPGDTGGEAGSGADPGSSGPDAEGGEGNASDRRIAAWRRQLRQMITGVAEVTAARWNDFPMAQKWSTVVASVGGAVGGLLVGLLLPSISAAVVTSLVGSLLWLTSGAWLLARFGVDPAKIGATSAVGVLLWWLIASGVGVIIQFKLKRRKADNK